MSEGNKPPSLDELDAKIKAARESKQAGGKGRNAVGEGPGANNAGVGFAFRLGTEMVASLIVGVGIGFLLDHWLDTGPWFMIVFFLLGAGAGISSVFKATAGGDFGVGYRKEDKGEAVDNGQDDRGTG